MRVSLIAAAISAALLAGCAAEGTYYGDYGSPYYGYGSPYYGYGYGYGYDYGPSYGPTYYYGPDYYSFYYRSGDGGYRWNGSGRTWQGSNTFQGSAQTPSRSASRTVAQPRVRSNTRVAQSERRFDRHERAARRPSHVASQTRTGPDREHGG
jgi:hypothetical protein